MIKPPYTKWINDIKTKLGFNRTMTASGEDVVDVVNRQADAIDEKADIPITVTVTVDSNGPSMSAADQAKLTSDMVMCWWYNPDKATKLNSSLTMIPGDGSISWGTNAATASSSTTFTIAFIHSANVGGIASIIQSHTETTASVNWNSTLTINSNDGVQDGNLICLFTTFNLAQTVTHWTLLGTVSKKPKISLRIPLVRFVSPGTEPILKGSIAIEPNGDVRSYGLLETGNDYNMYASYIYKEV